MSDIKITLPGCDDRDDDDDCDGDGGRGKRGKRGHRGHTGPAGETGPAGPVGPAGSGGLLKFSGFAAGALSGLVPVASFLADSGAGIGVGSILLLAQGYPEAIARSLRNLAVNIFGFTVPPLGSIVVELLQNGVPVPGFSVTYNTGDSGIKTVVAGPAPYAIGDTFDLRVTTTGILAAGVNVSATVGVE